MEKNTREVEQLKIEQGEVLRETCWGRLVKVTEEVTVTQWEKVNGVTETCTREIRHVELTETCETRHEVTECTETREIEGELDGVEEVKDEHTHTEVVEDNGGELAERVGTRCRPLGSLLQERGEGVCPLEADRDQVGSVVSSKFAGASAVDGCTESLGGMEAPGALEVTRVPMVNVPMCVFTSVLKCVL